MVSEFLSGFVVVLALVVVGCTLALLLSGMSKRFPFSRMALVFALTPLSFVRFLEYQAHTTLHLYAMIVILLGITIDGINYLLEPKARPEQAKVQEKTEQAEHKADSSPDVFVWEKAK